MRLRRPASQPLQPGRHRPTPSQSGLVAARRFDLMVLDLMLPGRNGLDILSERRASGDATPVPGSFRVMVYELIK